jgi:hypothetical protein
MTSIEGHHAPTRRSKAVITDISSVVLRTLIGCFHVSSFLRLLSRSCWGQSKSFEGFLGIGIRKPNSVFADPGGQQILVGPTSRQEVMWIQPRESLFNRAWGYTVNPGVHRATHPLSLVVEAIRILAVPLGRVCGCVTWLLWCVVRVKVLSIIVDTPFASSPVECRPGTA